MSGPSACPSVAFVTARPAPVRRAPLSAAPLAVAVRVVAVPVAVPLAVPATLPVLSETPGSIRWLGPALGAHTDEVLTEVLHRTTEEIAALRADGVV